METKQQTMATSALESHHPNNNNNNNNNNNLRRFIHFTSSNLLSFLTLHNNNTNTFNPKAASTSSSSSGSLYIPFQFSSSSSSKNPNQSRNSLSSAPSAAAAAETDSMASASGFPSTVRISGLNSSAKEGGPAFVGQVFSMCDISGTGLMAVSTHIEIPFFSKRTPEWIKKLFGMATKSEKKGPVFRFFMDLGDAVTYVKQIDIPTGVVGACRLDLAYEHFKEKRHMFQFVPNKKQVREANKLLKTTPQIRGRKRVHGVPVFTAQNLDIAIARTDGIKWYRPYFFDKKMLDNILEESVDQHFHTLIQIRHMQRQGDAIDDNLSAEVVEENEESMWEPPEVQDALDEMGHPGIPLTVISKAAEIQLLHAVDKVILGNRWLRKATGIQPKFPYMVDSFEERSAASFLKATESTISFASSEVGYDGSGHESPPDTSELELQESIQCSQGRRKSSLDIRFPFGDWFSNPWSKQQQKPRIKSDRGMEASSGECINQVPPPSPFLPKITMVGIATGEAGQMSRGSLKKTMEDLTQGLEQTGEDGTSCSSELKKEDRDPLFVANMGDYYSGMARRGSAQ